MARTITTCPIWGDQWEANGYYLEQDKMLQVYNSPRTGGGYRIPEPYRNAFVKQLTDAEKARLTTWLIDQRRQGDEQPLVTQEALNYAKNKSSLQVHERADRLLRFIAEQSAIVGTRVGILDDTDEVYAWSESIKWDEVVYFLYYLKRMNWLEGPSLSNGGFLGVVTVDGYNRIAEQPVNTESVQAFVAMWFDGQMDAAYEQGIRPAIEEAGYTR